eukprot:m.281565 g.281565  ORF g.281565 m.281565 type:complete len:107 (-) comp26977_c0_seq24:1378-1698(-)
MSAGLRPKRVDYDLKFCMDPLLQFTITSIARVQTTAWSTTDARDSSDAIDKRVKILIIAQHFNVIGCPPVSFSFLTRPIAISVSIAVVLLAKPLDKGPKFLLDLWN